MKERKLPTNSGNIISNNSNNNHWDGGEGLWVHTAGTCVGVEIIPFIHEEMAFELRLGRYIGFGQKKWM